MPQQHVQADPDCKEAQEYIEAVYNDPMTKALGGGAEAVQAWLRKHIKTCEACKEASILANMP